MNDKQRLLVEDNMKLVYSFVSKRYPTFIGNEDVIQVGMLGLCCAAEKWDSTKGKFSTYAYKCIGNSIKGYFRDSITNTVSLETPMGDNLILSDVVVGETDVKYIDTEFYKHLSPNEKQAAKLYNRGLETWEIAKEMDVSVSTVQKLLRIGKIKWEKFNEEN